MQGPVGIAEHFAGEEDEIGLALGDDGVGLMRVGDHADGSSGSGGFGADARGKGSLETGTDGDLCVRNQAAGGDVDEVDAVGTQETAEGDGVVWDQPPSTQSVAEMRTKSGRVGLARRSVLRRRPEGGGVCGFRSCRRKHRCVDWRAARGTHAADSRGRVDLNEVEAGGEGAFGGSAKAAMTASIPGWSSAWGTP